MLFAALTFWLFIIIFTAWGVHTLLSRLVKPRLVNSLLLPGTLVAQLGHVLGLLVTGNEVQNVRLMGDDEQGAPTQDAPQRSNLASSILIGLLPLLACAICLYVATRAWGAEMVGQANVQLAAALPTTLDGVWDLLRAIVTAMERMLDAIRQSDLTRWPTAVFLYLAVCLTVRMAPFEGHQRGAVVAIGLAGVLIWLIGMLAPRPVTTVVETAWPLLSFAVAMLLFLLLITLLVAGVVGLVRVLAKKQ